MENVEAYTEETIPTEEADVQEVESEAEAAPQEEAEEQTESTEDTEEALGEQKEAVQEDSFTIRYKHEDLNLTRDETKRLAQMGKHYEESVKGIIDDLDYFATLQGKSVKDLVSELVNGVEEKYRSELVEQFGEDNPLVEEMLELRRQKNRKAYDAELSKRETAEKRAEQEAKTDAATRLAKQLERVSSVFPEYKTAADIPDVVLKRATLSGDLEKEVFRYKLLEEKKIEAALKIQEKNKAESLGSVFSADTESGADAAFIKGLWRR